MFSTFLSLRRVDSGEGEAKRREWTGCRCSGTGAALAEAGEGGGRGGGTAGGSEL
jgi:hypothetical protein